MKKWLMKAIIFIVFAFPVVIMFGSYFFYGLKAEGYKKLEAEMKGTTYEILEEGGFYWCKPDYYDSFKFPRGTKIKLIGIEAQQNTPGGFIAEFNPDAHFTYEISCYENVICKGPDFRLKNVGKISSEEYEDCSFAESKGRGSI